MENFSLGTPVFTSLFIYLFIYLFQQNLLVRWYFASKRKLQNQTFDTWGVLIRKYFQQELITWSEQLPYLAYVTAFLRTSLFFDTFLGTFSRENRISTMSMRAFEV